MKVGIVGLGVVGGAMEQSFKNKNINVIGYDKYKKIGKKDDLLETHILFLCLPTLFDNEKKTFDKIAINEMCEWLVEKKYMGTVILKSTVEPKTTEYLAQKYQLYLFHSPEFLSAKTAYEEFHNQKLIILGKTNVCTQNHINDMKNFFNTFYPNSFLSICDSTESECAKIFSNCFYAVKIQFFNELYLLCDKLSVDYNIIKNLMIKNNWINPMHTTVPGTDGQLSYGGMCFPKDTNALLSFMQDLKTPHEILAATITERNKFRNN